MEQRALEQKTLRWHIGRSLALGLPMVIAQIMQMVIGVTDSLMVARLGALPLAQITLATQLVFFAVIVTVSFSIPVMPVFAKALTRGDETTARRALRMSIWQALMFCFVFVPFGYFSRPILTALGQDTEVIEGAGAYLDIAVWSLPMMFFTNTLKNYLIALERNQAVMVTSVIGVFVNALGNYALIFGHFGAPKLGLEGSAWATLFTHFSIMLAVLVIVLKEPMTERISLFSNFWKSDWEMFWDLIRMGVPTTFGILSEVGMFQMATLMMGWLGVTQLAAFGLVLQIASLTFMIPLGFSIVASVRAGQAIGHKDIHELHMVSLSSFIVITLTMIVTALIFVIFPEELMNLLLDSSREDSAILIALGVQYLLFAAAFQIFDGAQVAAISILRGVLDFFWPALFAFVAYWCLGMPIGYWLAFHQGWDGSGVWAGLVVGLGFASIFLWLRYFYVTRKENAESLLKEA